MLPYSEAETVDVLLVDDEMVNRRALKGLLEMSLQVRVSAAATPFEALDLAEKTEFAVLLLDVMLPDMDGFELAGRLKKIPLNAETPIIFFTAIGVEEKYALKGYESGAVDYMVKPFNQMFMVNKVRVFVDMYNQKKALAVSEARYKSMLDNQRSGVLVCRTRATDGAFVLCEHNAASAAILRFKPGEGTGAELAGLLPPGGEVLAEAMREVERTSATRWLECALRPEGGGEIALECDIYSIESGEVTAIVQDVSEVRTSRQRLQDQGEFFRSLIDAAALPIFYKDVNGSYLECNKAFERFLNLPRERIIGSKAEDIAPLGLAAYYKKMDEELVRRGGVQTYESTVANSDGELRSVVFAKTLYANSRGEPLGIIGVITDVTEQKLHSERVEAALGKARQRSLEVEALLEAAKAVLRHKDFALAARAIFDQCTRLTGATAGFIGLVARDGLDFEPLFQEPGDMPGSLVREPSMPIAGMLGEACRLGRTLHENDPGNGSWPELQSNSLEGLENILFAPLNVGNKTLGVLGLANKPGGFDGNDVHLATAFGEFASIALLNARTLESLERSEGRLRLAQRIAKLGSFDYCLKTGKSHWSEEMYNLFGLDRRQPPPDLGRFMDTVCTDRSLSCLEDLRQGRNDTLQPGVEARLATDGGQTATLLLHADLIRDLEGNPAMIRGTCQDITARKEIENLVLHSRKLESIGQLAAGMAHEINTPVQYLSANMDFLRNAWEQLNDSLASLESMRETEGEKSAELGRMLEEIPAAIGDSQNGLRKIADIVEAMRQFATKTDDELVGLRVDKALANILTVSENSWRKTAEITLDCEEGLPLAYVAPGDFNQILLSMLMNGLDAIEEANRSEGDKGLIAIRAHLAEDMVEISIRDNGAGIPEGIRDRIFDPFFTTKQVGHGTGQGLAVVYHLIKKNRGQVEFISTPGQGTEFIVRFPAHAPGEF